jgi:DNA invertase Pin-like site-specific DNA recombinase
MTKSICIYTRVSTVSQSTEQQLFTLREVANRNGTIVSEFTDTISGATDSRPGLDACLLAARQKKFDVLYCYSIDRLGRSTKNLISVVEMLQELKVDLFFYREGIDTTTPTGKCVFTILGSVAELERNLIRERVVSGLDKARRNGVRLGRPTVINPSMVQAIRLLRERGMTVRQISLKLKCGVGTCYKILQEAQAPEARLAA